MFIDVKGAIEEIKKGKILIVVDDEDRENEGDFVLASQFVTDKAINFMSKNGRGLICVPMESKRLDELNIPSMVTNNTSKHETAFAVSVGAKDKISTGISAKDRSTTIKTLIDKKTKTKDISMPGHIFPLRAREGGVLERSGHTEAAVDLAKLSNLYPSGVICEIMNEDGTMARLNQLEKVAKEFDLKIVTVKDIIKYRRKNEKLVNKVAEVTLPTLFGEFRAKAYKSLIDDACHLALIKGDIKGKKDVLVRVHSECLTGDVFHSKKCDCGDQMAISLQQIEKNGEGVFLYILGQEGRGIGLINKIKAYELQEKGHDTVEANEKLGFAPDLREYGIGAQILSDIGLSTIHLMTNNPVKIVGLEGYGLKITKRIPLEIDPNDHNAQYLKAKKEKLKHLLS